MGIRCSLTSISLRLGRILVLEVRFQPQLFCPAQVRCIWVKIRARLDRVILETLSASEQILKSRY